MPAASYRKSSGATRVDDHQIWPGDRTTFSAPRSRTAFDKYQPDEAIYRESARLPNVFSVDTA
jgi:hypothetical protein